MVERVFIAFSVSKLEGLYFTTLQSVMLGWGSKEAITPFDMDIFDGRN